MSSEQLAGMQQEIDQKNFEITALKNELNAVNARIQRCYDMMKAGDCRIAPDELDDLLISTTAQLISSKR